MCCKVLEKCSLCHYHHTPTFLAATLECCLWSVHVRVFPPSSLVAPGFIPEPGGRQSLHSVLKCHLKELARQFGWVPEIPQVVCTSVSTNILSLPMLRIKPVLS